MKALLLVLPLWAVAGHEQLAQAQSHDRAQAPADTRPAETPPLPGENMGFVREPRTPRSVRAFRPVLKAGVDDVLAEAGAFSQAPQADVASTLRLSPYVLWQPAREWEFRAGLRLEGESQAGGAADYTRWRGEVADTFVRYRSGDARLTAGAQTILWGRVDEVSLLDRVSRVDLTRFAIDRLPERRRAQFALRWEQTIGDYKLDAVLLPTAFQGAELPDTRSVWSPVNRVTGRIIGVAPNPALAPLLQAAPLDQVDGGAGGWGVRLTRSGVAPVDLGLTLARTRQSLPIFRLQPAPLRLMAEHPYAAFAGVDLEWVTGSLTWRSELGYTDNQTVTTATGAPLKTQAFDWVGALEFFPGGKDIRVSLQLLAHRLKTDEAILELKEYYGVSGEIEAPLDQGRWKVSTRFFSGLNVHDVYLAPRLSFLAWEPHEIYLTARYFAGADRALAGFHRDHGQVAIGIKSRF